MWWRESGGRWDLAERGWEDEIMKKGGRGRGLGLLLGRLTLPPFSAADAMTCRRKVTFSASVNFVGIAKDEGFGFVKCFVYCICAMGWDGVEVGRLKYGKSKMKEER